MTHPTGPGPSFREDGPWDTPPVAAPRLARMGKEQVRAERSWKGPAPTGSLSSLKFLTAGGWGISQAFEV